MTRTNEEQVNTDAVRRQVAIDHAKNMLTMMSDLSTRRYEPEEQVWVTQMIDTMGKIVVQLAMKASKLRVAENIRPLTELEREMLDRTEFHPSRRFM